MSNPSLAGSGATHSEVSASTAVISSRNIVPLRAQGKNVLLLSLLAHCPPPPPPRPPYPPHHPAPSPPPLPLLLLIFVLLLHRHLLPPALLLLIFALRSPQEASQKWFFTTRRFPILGQLLGLVSTLTWSLVSFAGKEQTTHSP